MKSKPKTIRKLACFDQLSTSRDTIATINGICELAKRDGLVIVGAKEAKTGDRLPDGSTVRNPRHNLAWLTFVKL